jgi:apolipoprotein D and lipocalin family protein
MRRRALLGLLALVACAPEPEAPAPAASFRDRSVPIGSTTRGTVGDLAGDWVIAQSFPGPAFAAPGRRLRVEPEAGGGAILRFEGAGDLRAASAGPGRLSVEGGPELWVLWVDDDFRTAALGTPDGSLGWIMDRPGQASGDRTAAAREVLDWSGYDVARLSGGA